MRHLRKWLILSHRYLGIALGLVFVAWFASGIVMIYAGGMPQLSPELRRESLAPLDMSAVRLTAAEAAQRALITDAPRTTMLTVLGRPAYRFGTRTVFADTGETLQPIDGPTARMLAARFIGVPESDIEFMHEVRRPDQWTLTLSRALPLLKFRARDDAGTELYVSPRTAEVVLATTNRDRLLAWTGVIPHWLYFAPLRLNQPLWYSVVVYLSEIGVVMAVLGLVVGIMRFKPTQAIPRHGFDSLRRLDEVALRDRRRVRRVHADVGVQRPVVDGAVRVDQRDRPRVRARGDDGRAAGADALLEGEARRRGRALTGDRVIKEVELTRIQDEPYYVVAPGIRRQAGARASGCTSPIRSPDASNTIASWSRRPRCR